MRTRQFRFGLVLSLAAAWPAVARAQDAPAGPPALRVGDAAPEFTLPVSTREGIGNAPARLRDFRGQTVVLAFFPKARTGG